MIHPRDLDYIKNMVPNISMEIVNQLKNLKPGNCIAFGNAFKIPVSMYIDLPNPRPMSNNVDISTVWYQGINYSPTMMVNGTTSLLGIYPTGAFINNSNINNEQQRFVSYNYVRNSQG